MCCVWCRALQISDWALFDVVMVIADDGSGERQMAADRSNAPHLDSSCTAAGGYLVTSQSVAGVYNSPVAADLTDLTAFHLIV
jgi:hypothetical protein